MCVYVCVYVRVCVYVCVYVCMCVCVYAYTGNKSEVIHTKQRIEQILSADITDALIYQNAVSVRRCDKFGDPAQL